MKKSLPIFLLSGFLVFYASSLFAQTPIEKLTTSFKDYNSTFPWEKVYLHTDKAHYVLNDTIWIKAYGMIENGGEAPLATKSVPLYVDLYDAKFERYIDRIIIRLEEGQGQGDIILPRDLEHGAYSLRAYTQWMKNFGDQAYFYKDIWVGELGEGWKYAGSDSKLNLGFFPEGGDLVEGIKSKIGFKATDAYGRSTDVIGYILNSSSDTLLRFQSEHLGMGSFTFTSKENESYEVYAKSSEQDWKKFAFSNIQKQGYVLDFDPLYSDEEVKVEIRHNLGNANDGKKLFLIGLSKGQKVYEKEFDAKHTTNSIIISKEDFYPGLVTFTLMDEQTTLLAERLVYFFPFSRATAAFKTAKAEYVPKERVLLEISVIDEFQRAIEGNFSVSVTDAFQVLQPDNAENIHSYFLLSSEVKGEIEQPDYYFNSENPNAEKYLDILLLTQGWRRFSWEHLAKLSSPPNYGFEEGLTLTGKVYKVNEKPIEEPHELRILVNHRFGMPIVYEGVSNEFGEFSFIGMDYQDSVGIYLQAYTEREKSNGKTTEVKRNEVSMTIPETPKFQERNKALLPSGDKFEDFDNYLVSVKEARNLMEQFRLSQEIELGEVTVKGRRSQPIPDKRAIQYNDAPDRSLPVTKEFYYFQNIFQVLRGRFPGVNVVGDVFSINPVPSVIIRGGGATFENAGGATFFIDGMRAMPGMVAILPVSEIERIDILTGLSKGSLFGNDGAGGVINVLTKAGNPNRNPADDPITGNAAIKAKGYVPVREFYSPSGVYDINAPFAIDFRSTIYWNPNVVTDNTGKAHIEFLLTESKPEVFVNLQGISTSGEPIYATYRFQVK
ncbi:TonB-dependent receptor plug domain-containing protein [Aquiflexum sp. LQ15W]|uniref:TonB-dependent receptor n=1 Tax=Cognataquiflexum nitidum TaxID=2922272 RepID=UPI001F147B13|nr:Plug domain-containing protein [Cognataquiflexum nitidum]MCH6200181.1 TonB-dependent receptor plug domain-containing protein [Cognataquiflexum nitidum]